MVPPVAAELPDTAIALQLLPISRQERIKMRAAYFFLAFKDPDYANRKLDVDSTVGVQRIEARYNIALGVSDASAKHLAFAHNRLEWLRGPLLRVTGGLHIIVVIN